MTSWIIAFMSRRQSRELPTHSYISLKITLKIILLFDLHLFKVKVKHFDLREFSMSF